MSSNRDRDKPAHGHRFGHRSGTGANAPLHGEKKEQRDDWVHRQGGDQSRDPDEHGRRVDDRHAR